MAHAIDRAPINRGTLCTAITEDGEECGRPLEPAAPISFCALHGLLAAQWMIQTHPDMVDKVLALEADEVRHRKHGPQFHYMKPAVVYYVRLGSRIKIGTTTNLPQRMVTVPNEQLLAVEPGGYPIERKRHAQFHAARVHREWFLPVPELLNLVNDLRQRHGEPMEAWKRATRRDPEMLAHGAEASRYAKSSRISGLDR